MKLIPRAKPVKIRIMSGDREHSSLQSLKGEFKWSDIRKVIDNGSLEKWLRRLGEYEIADDFKDREHLTLNLREAYNLLFRRDHPFPSDKKIIEESMKDSSLSSLLPDLASQWSHVNLAQYVKEYGDKVGILKKILDQRIETLTGLEPPSMMYDLGFILYSMPEYQASGIRYIGSAAERDHKKAKELMATIEIEHVNGNIRRSRSVENQLKTIFNTKFSDRIQHYWNVKAPLSTNGQEGLKLEVINLFNKCQAAYKGRPNAEAFFRRIENELSVPYDPTDSLYYEKVFIRALFSPYSSARQALMSIYEYYPAQELLHKGEFRYKCMVLKMMDKHTNMLNLGHYLSFLDKFVEHE